jgi:hypothetical protein
MLSVTRRLGLVVAIVSLGFTTTAMATTPLGDRASAVDVAVDVADAPGTLFADDVLLQDAPDTGQFSPLGIALRAAGLPEGVRVTSIHYAVGTAYFSLDIPVTLGGTVFTPDIVIKWSGGSFTNHFTVGVAGARLDAFTGFDPAQISSAGAFSFDAPVLLGSVLVFPGDVAEYDDDSWSVVFDAALAGVPTGVNVDAAHRLPNDNWLVSFDLPVVVGGLFVQPEDVAEWNGAVWELAINASAEDAAWSSANRTAFFAIAAADDVCPGTVSVDQTDSDSDQVPDACDSQPGNPDFCRDADDDTCDDCVSGTDDSSNDGLDTEGDGLCDAGDLDDDGDGLLDADELFFGSDPLDEDSDSDGVCDGGNQIGSCTATGPDNCPLVSNVSQTNLDGFFAGDDCQCGDATGDGTFSALDIESARLNLVGATNALGFDADRCNLVGPSTGQPSDCDVADIAAMRRALGKNSDPPPLCEAWNPTP